MQQDRTDLAVREGPSALPRVVHVSGDFPDPVDADKTKAVRSLVNLTDGHFNHSVYSLNRVGPGLPSLLSAVVKGVGTPRLKVETTTFDQGVAVRYFAPGRGIYHKTMLEQLGDWLAEELADDPPALLVGHKLTIEGIVVARAARKLCIPYALSLQGDTDTKILGARRDLRAVFGRIYRDASVVFPFAPWTRDQVEQRIGGRSGPTVMLPCATHIETVLPPKATGNGLVSVFHLKSAQRKNLQGMVQAAKLLEAKGSTIDLRIIGGGSAHDVAACEALVENTKSVTLAGPADRDGVRAAMNAAAGFVLPSLRESFGMVFIEALKSGVPIAYPQGTAVDGYLDGLPFAIRVNARDPASIAAAMQTLVEKQTELKAGLAEWLSGEGVKRFSDERIARDFSDGLNAALGA